MLRLKDGRVCLTYGYRRPPYGMRACLSADGGRTWGKQIVLRDDGGGRDVGYPRSVQTPRRPRSHDPVLLSRSAEIGPVYRGHDLGPR